jgi:GTP cyclohydrolase IA
MKQTINGENDLSNLSLNGHSKIILSGDEMGDDHFMTTIDTPMVATAFDKTDEEKIAVIEHHFRKIMETLGLDLSDDSLKGTPKRVAKMYVKEIFSGLNPDNMPALALFENKYQYNEMLIEKNIAFYSNCEHHFVPIIGKAHVAYISNGKVIGLSKLNRIVQHFAKRPQVQERLTVQIAKELEKILGTKYPDRSKVQLSHLQKKSNGLFRQAVAYSKAILRDDAQKAALEKKLKSRKKTFHQSAYQAAIQEFMLANSNPVSITEAEQIARNYQRNFQLTERQFLALKFLALGDVLNNAVYQSINKVSKPTATRDLQLMVKKGVLNLVGRGAGAKYLLQNSGQENDV